MKQVLLALLLTGCSSIVTSPSARFDSIFTIPYEAELTSKFSNFGWMSTYESIYDVDEKLQVRNQIILELMWLCDQDYTRYINFIYDSRTWLNFATDVITFGASSAATVAAPGAQTVLAGIAAGTSGLRGIANSNLFNDNTKNAILIQMNALRQTAKADMLDKLSMSVASYPLVMAIQDVSWYSQQGNTKQAIDALAFSSAVMLKDQIKRVGLIRLDLTR